MLLLNVHVLSFPSDGCSMILITRLIARCKQGRSIVCLQKSGFAFAARAFSSGS